MPKDSIYLKVVNVKTGAYKLLNVTYYTGHELQKTYEAYEAHGNFYCKILRP